MSRKPRFFLSVPVWRALLETWGAGALGLLALLYSRDRLLDIVLGQAVFFLVSAVTFWYALRLRYAPQHRLVSMLWYELKSTLALCLLGVGGWFLLLQTLSLDAVLSSVAYPPFGVAWLGLLSFPLFIAARVALYIWRFWQELRRKHILWSFTHIQLQLVFGLAVAFLLLSAAVVLLGSGQPQPLGDLDTWVRAVLPVVSIVGAATIFAIIVVLPVAALIAWLTARKVTRRLEALTQATAALRDGDVAIRIAVDGEDEVAQLQEDFNAMAASLEAAMAALQSERDKVSSLLDSRRQMIVGVSHELRTPLATLRGYVESMQLRAQVEPVARDLVVMDHELTRLQTLIDDLFTLSRADVDGLALELRPVETTAVITRCIDTVAPLAWQRDRVRVIAQFAEGCPLVLADEHRIEQIVVNLLRNALRHTPPGGIVVVRLEVETRDLCLSVCDTGEGIPAGDLPHIWERFYRGAQARARDAHGAGLGLALVKELAEAMGGRVSAESTPGEGACFRIWLPIVCDKGATTL